MKLWNYHTRLEIIGKTCLTRSTVHSLGELIAFSQVRNQKGIFTLITALSVFALFAFTALGIEVGRWYVARSEMSKAVDAAALIGAKNIGNPYLNAEDLMEAVGAANFTPGFLGSEGVLDITGTVLTEGRVSVVANNNILNTVTRIMEAQSGVQQGTYEKVLVASSGSAQQRDVEILMVLDSSGSMGSSMSNLKDAASSFVGYFSPTEDNDKFGLIHYASGVVVDFPMGHDFVMPMQNAINALSAEGGTNTEDAIDQADGPSGFTDQTGVSGDLKVQQFMIFFSDGNPTAFRGTFTRNGTPYDAVGYAANPYDWKLMDPNVQMQWLTTWQYETGNGLPAGSGCSVNNTKWHVLDDPVYGVNGYSEFSGQNYSDILGTTNPEQCSINRTNAKNYVQAINYQMSIDHAQELKDKGIKIYTIGLGSVDQSFLAEIASGPGFEYYTPDSNELMLIFQKVATNIKLRLLE